MTSNKSIHAKITAMRKNSHLTSDEVNIISDNYVAFPVTGEKSVEFCYRYLQHIAPLKLKKRKRPFLMVSARDLDISKALIKGNEKMRSKWNFFKKRCDAFITPRHRNYIDHQARQKHTLWKTRTGHMPLNAAVEDLAWAYRMGGGNKYGKVAKDILLAIATSRHGWKAMGSNFGKPYQGWMNDHILDIGKSTFGFSVAFDLIENLMSSRDKENVANYFEPYFYRYHSLGILMTWNPWGCNRSTVPAVSMGLLALSLYDLYPKDRREVLDHCIRYATAYAQASLENTLTDDGGALEGFSYVAMTLGMISRFAHALARCGDKRILEHPAWEKHIGFARSELLPGQEYFLEYNDSHSSHNLEYYRLEYWPLFSRFSENRLSIGVMSRLFELDNKSSRAPLSGLSLAMLRQRDFEEASKALAFVEKQHFRDIDHLNLRTGYDSGDLFVSFQCTKSGPRMHRHHDQLNFVLYALGEDFAIDSGYGMLPIPGTSQVQRLGAYAQSHNKILVDGNEAEEDLVRGGRIIKQGARGLWHWALADASQALETTQTMRRAILVKVDRTHPVVIIADLVVSGKGKRKYDWLLQTQQNNELRLKKGTTELIGGRFGKRMYLSQRANLELQRKKERWIDHPRLCLSGHGEYLVMLSVFSTEPVDLKKGPSRLSAFGNGSTDLGNAVLKYKSPNMKRGEVNLSLIEQGIEVSLF